MFIFHKKKRELARQRQLEEIKKVQNEMYEAADNAIKSGKKLNKKLTAIKNSGVTEDLFNATGGRRRDDRR